MLIVAVTQTWLGEAIYKINLPNEALSPYKTNKNNLNNILALIPQTININI